MEVQNDSSDRNATAKLSEQQVEKKYTLLLNVKLCVDDRKYPQLDTEDKARLSMLPENHVQIIPLRLRPSQRNLRKASLRYNQYSTACA